MTDFIEHLKAMGNLEGMATDYPVMFVAYLGIFVACLITTVMIAFSKYGKRIVWLPDQHKIIKSRFSYMAMLACTFTGVFLVGSFPAELQNTYGTWNADFFYTIGQTSVMIVAGIYALATYKERRSTVLNAEVERKLRWVSDHVIGLSDHFRSICFDDLAVQQLCLKDKITDQAWKRFYMGGDGEFTMYVDLVKGEFAASSVAERWRIDSNDLANLFSKVRSQG